MVSIGVKYDGEISATLSPDFRKSGFAQFRTTGSSGVGMMTTSSSSLLHDVSVVAAIMATTAIIISFFIFPLKSTALLGFRINTFKSIGLFSLNLFAKIVIFVELSLYLQQKNCNQTKNKLMKPKITTILVLMLLPMIGQAQRQQYQQVKNGDGSEFLTA
jgi:hypothetical protein